jgi:hypothetical protein
MDKRLEHARVKGSETRARLNAAIDAIRTRRGALELLDLAERLSAQPPPDHDAFERAMFNAMRTPKPRYKLVRFIPCNVMGLETSGETQSVDPEIWGAPIRLYSRGGVFYVKPAL